MTYNLCFGMKEENIFFLFIRKLSFSQPLKCTVLLGLPKYWNDIRTHFERKCFSINNHFQKRNRNNLNEGVLSLLV